MPAYKVITSNAKEYTIEEPTAAELIADLENGRKGEALTFVTVYKKPSKVEPVTLLASSIVSIN